MEYVANRYQLINQLGEGGMGVVYRAYDRLEQIEVALKRVKYAPDELEFNAKVSYGDAKVGILQEFRTLASLRHPKIISVLDYGFDSEQIPFFTMPLLEEAQSIVEYGLDYSDKDKTFLLIQTLQALVYLHRRDILHRDLKPANILVTSLQNVRVLDFGLSTDVSYSAGRGGTLAYMAPEVLLRQANSRVADLYAVGLIAYELFVGRYPFDMDDPTRLIEQILETIPDTAMLASPGLATVLNRWLLKDPDDRYQSANDVIEALCDAVNIELPQETIAIREGFLQASAFVGRDKELSTLESALKGVMQGNTAFYLVAGESGIGKSRLLDELRIAALVSGASVLRGRSVVSGAPFQLWRNIVRRLLLHVEVDDTQASILKEIVPDIEKLLGRDVPDIPSVPGTDSGQKLMSVIVDLIKRSEQTLVILLEDLQWAEASLVLIKQLMKAKAELSHVMIAGNYRIDEAPDLAQDLEHFTLIKLNRLDKQAIQSLSYSMLGENGAKVNVVDLLHNETEGNLFFLVETVRALAESAGGLQNIGIMTLPQKVFTGGMQQIMQHRLSKVSEAYVDIQSLAAVIGREIDLQLLVSQFPQQDVDKWISNATEVAVLAVHDNHYLFAHDKFREAILRAIPDVDKAGLHRQAAQSIEAVYPENEDYYLSLLNHWRNAGDLPREEFYLELIARRLIQFEANYSDSARLLDDFLLRCPSEASFRNRVLNLAGELRRRKHEFDMALDFAQQVLSNNPTPEETIHALETIGAVTYFQGNLSEAIETWQEMLNLSIKHDNLSYQAAGFNNLGFVSYQQQDYPVAKDYLTRSIEVSRRMPERDVFTFTNALQNLAFITLQLEDYETAGDYFMEALDAAYTIRIIPLLLTVLTGLAHLEALLGDSNRAARWVGMIDAHSALRSETRATKLNPVIALLKNELSSEQFATQFKQGASLDLLTVAQSIIDGMS